MGRDRLCRTLSSLKLARRINLSRPGAGRLLGVGLLLGLAAPDAQAVPLGQATSPRAGFSLGNVDAVSYDGKGFDAFKPFGNIFTSQILSLGSFTGLAGLTDVSVTLLSESAAFDGSIPGVANRFGVVKDGQFTSIIDSTTVNPGGVGHILQDPNEQFTFALQSPEGLFTTIDSQNPDGRAHIIVREVAQNGQVTINPTNVRGGPSFTLDLLAGDLVLFIEDLLESGDIRFLDGLRADFDYNDFVVVVRQTQVPEPGTALLLGTGILAFRRRRKMA